MRPHENGFLLCEIPALGIAFEPGLKSSFGQGQAVTSR